ncbi:DUF1796 family putative cysteine peptidase [Priestia taiwanensis]|uniref:Papain-like cysteine peptidase n=1 Tax=Priestia taiwanensis TaxID=1347902 RepID=A0A917ERB8_9BACI|nr:DUF1796 family putative cysteine peptidase [Priestia taiwanensis]MBM7364734.1 hypothetical protein [Priestia taiwanensis]GGE79214.1 hypothetical protein GCM10007140_30980 [Priestia taiwanensis]
MRLQDIKGKYDATYSLGNQCAIANKLRHYRLRPYAGVTDWMLTAYLPGLSKLLRNRFANFMEKENMIFDGYHAAGAQLFIKDTLYDISAAHDFSTIANTPTDWPVYPQFKAKVDRRIRRFLRDMETCERILFIRMMGTFEETKELEAALSSIIKHDFTLLMLNPINEIKIIEYEWDIPHVCSLGIPMGDEFPEVWDVIMGGIMCSGQLIMEEHV